MKEQELNELLDSVIGTKGNFRVPSYWMRKVFSDLMEWCKGLTPKVNVPTRISQLENDMGYVDSYSLDNRVNNLSSTLNNKITALETQTKKIGTSQSNDPNRTLSIYLSGQHASFVRKNMFPNNQTVNISNTTFDGTSYRLIVVAKNITFSCSNSYTIINPYFECDDYCVCEFSFTIIANNIFIARTILSKVNLIKITPKTSEGFRVILTGITNKQEELYPSCVNDNYYIISSLNWINSSNPVYGYMLTDQTKDITSTSINEFSNVKTIEYTEGFTYAKDFLNQRVPDACTIVFPETFDRFEGNSTFKNAQNVTLDFTKSKEVVKLNVYNQNWLTFIVPDDLYDEWIIASNWSQMASQIVKASEYTE